MTATYHIFGSELSPYSVKVRSYSRSKEIPHEWVSRSREPDEFKKYARLPLMPLVVTPELEGNQDLTPMIEKMERLFPEPSIYPKDPLFDSFRLSSRSTTQASGTSDRIPRPPWILRAFGPCEHAPARVQEHSPPAENQPLLSLLLARPVNARS